MKIRRWALATIILCAAGCGKESLPELTVGTADAGSVFIKAIQDGDVAVVQQFLEADPDLAFADLQMGQTALHFAAGAKNAAIVRLLLDKGADPSLMNDEGVTPADTARAVGASQEIIDMLSGNR